MARQDGETGAGGRKPAETKGRATESNAPEGAKAAHAPTAEARAAGGGALTAAVAVVAGIALAVTLVAAGFFACAVPDAATVALAGAFSDDADSPFTKGELVDAAVAAKHYTIDDNDAYDVTMQVALINAQAASDGRAGKGAPDLGSVVAQGPDGGLAIDPTRYDDVKDALAGASERYTLTPDALSHLDDVYRVVQAARPWLFAALIAACVGCTAVAFRGGRRALGRVLVAAGGAVLAAFAVMAAWVAVDFDGFFAAFHSLFFAAGTWTFSWDSLLICMYPPRFWIGMGAVWLAATVAGCLVCLIIGRSIARPRRP